MGFTALLVALVSLTSILAVLALYSRIFKPEDLAQAQLVVASYRDIGDSARDKRSQRRIKSRSLEYSRSVSLLRRALLAKLLMVLTVYSILLLAYTLLLAPFVKAPFTIPLFTVMTEEGPQVSTAIVHFLVFVLAILAFRETPRRA
ncbi:MAG: hypothetical protein QXS85_06090 [Acidilobaceae archaeon]